jgi:prevent-host-death family protein
MCTHKEGEMSSINIREARQHLSDLVSAAEHGEEVTITRNGKEVAQLVPVRKRRARLPDLRAFRASMKVKGKSLSKTVIDARREARY